MSAEDLKARLQTGDETLTELEMCIGYAVKIAPKIAERVFSQLSEIQAGHDAKNALVICVMMLTNVNTITEENQVELIRQLRLSGMIELADAVAIGGMASVWEA